jgi:hypothetical protein
VALAWGSASTIRVLFSEAASEAPRFTAVVVFPTPPFWLAMATILAKEAPPVAREFSRGWFRRARCFTWNNGEAHLACDRAQGSRSRIICDFWESVQCSTWNKTRLTTPFALNRPVGSGCGMKESGPGFSNSSQECAKGTRHPFFQPIGSAFLRRPATASPSR